MSTTAEKLAAELEAARRTDRVVTTCVWSVAGVVVIYGLGIVYQFVVGHGVPKGIAWMLSPAVDAGLCLGLVATAVLARHGIAAGWVNALRWITALMTLGLNIGKPLTHKPGIDWVGVGIHAAGPILLWVTVEAAAAYQQKIGKVIADLEERKQREDRHRADLADRVRKAEAERAQALQRLSALESQVAAVTAERDSLAVSGDAARDAAETLQRRLSEQAETLQHRHTAELERLTGEHRETLRRQSEKHTEALRALRAELTTVNLTDRRRGAVTSGGESPKPAPVKPVKTSPETSVRRSPLSDDECLELMLGVSTDPAHQWTGPALRDLTGAGYSRIPRLIQAWTERVTAAPPTAITATAN